jgi:acetyl-CoA decarbonylase/synthase complex subunit delta
VAFQSSITKVVLGEGSNSITLGGVENIPYLETDYRPKIALEISDKGFRGPSEVLSKEQRSLLKNPLKWLDYYSEKYSIDAVEINITKKEGIDNLFEPIATTTDFPIILSGTGFRKKDTELFQKCCEVTERKNLLLCSAELDQYKSIAALALLYNHCLVAESPIDVNIAKQLNILLTDFGLPFEKIIIDPLSAALGYGLEYTYSVMERIRGNALNGDDKLLSPMICFGQEGWKAREATNDYPSWGPIKDRGILWEVFTALTLYSAGGDLVVFRHPNALELFLGIFSEVTN